MTSVTMRPGLIVARLIAAGLLVASLLSACQMIAPVGTPLTTDEISVTPLAAPDGSAPMTGATPAHPKPRPDTLAEPAVPATPDAPTVEPVASEPAAPKSPAQLLCEKSGGQWLVAGETGAYICVSPTRDGGKLCRKKSDCQGLCLARSGTCAPFTPLFGCNDVLEKDGRRVTLCID